MGAKTPAIFERKLNDISASLLGKRTGVCNSTTMTTMDLTGGTCVLVESIILNIKRNFRPVTNCGCNTGGPRHIGGTFVVTVVFNDAISVLNTVTYVAMPAKVVTLLKTGGPRIVGVNNGVLVVFDVRLPLLNFSSCIGVLCRSLNFMGNTAFLTDYERKMCFVPLVLLLPV